MASTRMRVDSEKSFVPSKTTLGEKSTPRVWITTSMSRSTFRIVSGSSALPTTLVRFASWIGMPAAERAKARTLWPAPERGPHRFKSDAVAGTYDEDFGHDSPNSYLFSDQY